MKQPLHATPAAPRWFAAMGLIGLAIGAAAYSGCRATDLHDPRATTTAAGDSPYVVSLGNFRAAAAPSQAETALADFLFGTTPEPSATLLKPLHLAASGKELWVTDGALQALYRWTPESKGWQPIGLKDLPSAPGALAISESGALLVAGESGAVMRYAPGTEPRALVSTGRETSRPIGGVTTVGDEVWISNTAGHCLEVYDASGRHSRSIGRRGRGPGQFGFPLGLATDAAGHVYVADMLNGRVQVLDRDGKWLRDIGQQGDRVGALGRPRGVAIGPDNTLFVTDAAGQCVKAFDAASGRALLSFGGSVDGDDALVLPMGVATWSGALTASRPSPGGFSAKYHVLVAEQISKPGLRVYAWSGLRTPPVEPGRGAAVQVSGASPHWRSDRCDACHQPPGTRQPIPHEQVNQGCLRCHDGRSASKERHPIHSLAATFATRAPDGWPLLDGRLTCLTCHEFGRHCNSAAQRPTENPAFVRGFDPEDALAQCLHCHTSSQWRVNPHRAAPSNDSVAGCGFCHIGAAHVPQAGRPGENLPLRAATTRLCLNCHTMHADPAPHGHLGLTVSNEILHHLADGRARNTEQPNVNRYLMESRAPVAVLPLEDARITCATCHDPHFDAVGARHAGDETAPHALRLPHVELCQRCHAK